VHISVISCICMKVALSMISFLRESSFLCFSDQIGDVWEFPFLHSLISVMAFNHLKHIGKNIWHLLQHLNIVYFAHTIYCCISHDPYNTRQVAQSV